MEYKYIERDRRTRQRLILRGFVLKYMFLGKGVKNDIFFDGKMTNLNFDL